MGVGVCWAPDFWWQTQLQGGGVRGVLDSLMQAGACVETAVTSPQQYLVRKHLPYIGAGAVKTLDNGIRGR